MLNVFIVKGIFKGSLKTNKTAKRTLRISPAHLSLVYRSMYRTSCNSLPLELGNKIQNLNPKLRFYEVIFNKF